jgi:hypothetical protein
MFSDENLGKAIDFVDPKVNSWAKDLFGSFEQFLYNTLMSNEEIIAILSDIIRNIATRHAYGMFLDWGKRASLFKAPDKEK